MSDKTLSQTQPYFQKLQLDFAQHIRNPQQAYAPAGEPAIEARRLKVYESLFFNNIDSFFSHLFPVCQQVMGQVHWQQLLREYMLKHRARTPLFHRLGEEFLAFLNSDYEAQAGDPAFLLEMAHYEWVELALEIAEAESVENAPNTRADLKKAYGLSALAWPLAYQWPVAQISVDYQPAQPLEQPATLLVFRNVDYEVEFMEISPLLYQWLTRLEGSTSAEQALMSVVKVLELEADLETLLSFAEQTLQQFIDMGIVYPLHSVQP
ncbi:MAG: putative DNA-binding domain-containing protein [Thiomicrorhabdus chilensis]|uniref:HvfC family RiPP maturation protein n=1 Tax=Thiomicrorhabdus chilensis TaxID=63656 RepID=UPI00299D58C8|nr:putative DNA-binding domain-containing protein [Thiomicrorhabdus chilensis]MDX1347719.1 putative DNA-binding domain-containing protein [Thiomicrorhabdus chilensis]